ncbi:MAG: hypothetical protein RL338_55 [Chloroflexota bacterium]
MSRRRVPLLAALLAVATLAGCSGGPSADDGSGAAPTTAPVAATPAPSPIVIEVRLTDSLRMEPAEMTVPVGVPVTFVVTNAGANPHEFVLGSEEEQQAHDAEMAQHGAMMHDHDYAIAVEAGKTKELTWTFDEVGETYAGCHYPGHYGAGMKATITVVAGS